MKRKRYTIEFKQQVVKEAQEVGNAAQVARRHGITPKQIYDWKKQAESTAWKQAPKGAKSVETYLPTPQEFQELEQENVKLKQILGDKDLEIAILRDLLKKKNPAYRID
jgi:transposase-like protein